MLTGLWNLNDTQNSRQNRSKNKLVRENAVTIARGSFSLRVANILALLWFIYSGWVPDYLLAEVSRGKKRWRGKRETSAGLRYVFYDPCTGVSLTTSNVLVTCDKTYRTRLSLIVRMNVVLNRTVVVDSD